MSANTLESTLRNLSRIGRLVKDRAYRQVWRFDHEGRAYYLKFYPKAGPRDRFRRFFRGSPALAEFARLQALQRAAIPAPRAVAAMVGFTLNHRRGDAVILEAVEPSEQLDTYLTRLRLAGEPIPHHRQLVEQVLNLVEQLQQAGLGHEDLHLGNFLMHDGRLLLLDGYAVHSRLRRRDVMLLGHSVAGLATTTDLLRGWHRLGFGHQLPRHNPVSQLLWRRFASLVVRRNKYFGRLRGGDGWGGIFYQRSKSPQRWSTASQLQITEEDWQKAWPLLLQRMQGQDVEWIKRTRSGEVFATQLPLAGQDRSIIVKRPRRRYWYRYVNEIGRGSRPRRAWKKSWALIARGLPTAWPLLLMERRVAGYVVDALIACERVPGPTLAHVDLADIPAPARQNLLHRTGKILRQIEALGYSHFDAKASNWIVRDDPATGPAPVLIDADGVRRRRWIGLGINRLLRSLQKENPSYTAEDSLSLCRGYAPYAATAASPQPAQQPLAVPQSLTSQS